MISEKDFFEIIDAFEKANEETGNGLIDVETVCNFKARLYGNYLFSRDWQKILAIANPLTRSWAYEEYIKKDKKFYWWYKQLDDDGESWYLTNKYGIITTSCSGDFYGENQKAPLTEKEVYLAGYNPHKFRKEEVDND
ncbi:hypothetical protein H7198_06055 [Fructobacillus sp. CRL 2054]|uniref:hypothetical protein n=1 Tax=Fructobacillus sp. CRL 2054 TaxID=2763007 RepID=UPI002379BF82|nr:hypothetical protein [Fructobacillus sp. CRL 2054]MDD9139164.1 hypothetical protein [Fructobacillus sp. CRL 2054]